MITTYTPTLRPATAVDVPSLAVLATQVFLDTYATDGIRPDLAREALDVYGVPAFERRIAEPQRRFTLAEREGHLIGFAEVLLGGDAPQAGLAGTAELVRLYVQRPSQGQGVAGAALLRASEAMAAGAGAPLLWLTAWSGNGRALRFYARHGYADRGATDYVIEGRHYQNRVLARNVPPAAP